MKESHPASGDVTWEDATRLDDPTTIEPATEPPVDGAETQTHPVKVPEAPTVPERKMALDASWDDVKTSLATGDFKTSDLKTGDVKTADLKTPDLKSADLKTDRAPMPIIAASPSPPPPPPPAPNERFGDDGTELDLNLWAVPSEPPLVQDWSEPSITKHERPKPSAVEITLPPAPTSEPQKLLPEVVPARPEDVLVSAEIEPEAVEAARATGKRTLEALARSALASPTGLPPHDAPPRPRAETIQDKPLWQSNIVAVVLLFLMACAAGVLTFLIAVD